MKSIVIRPNWSPLACGRNTYLKFLLSSTAEEMQVVIHMNFLSCSTRAATGTHCADEIEAEQHVDLFLLDQPDRLVDGDIGLALGVGVDRLDLVALDPGLGVLVEHDLGADILQLRAAARERAGQVVNHADLDFLFLGLGGNRHTQRRDRGHQPTKHAGSLTHRHQNLPGKLCIALLICCDAHHTGSADRCQAPSAVRPTPGASDIMSHDGRMHFRRRAIARRGMNGVTTALATGSAARRPVRP